MPKPKYNTIVDKIKLDYISSGKVITLSELDTAINLIRRDIEGRRIEHERQYANTATTYQRNNQNNAKRKPCHYFSRNGSCNRGDRCKFLHISNNKNNTNNKPNRSSNRMKHDFNDQKFLNYRKTAKCHGCGEIGHLSYEPSCPKYQDTFQKKVEEALKKKEQAKVAEEQKEQAKQAQQGIHAYVAVEAKSSAHAQHIQQAGHPTITRDNHASPTISTALSASQDDDEFIADSGASSHITNDPTHITNPRQCHIPIYTADSKVVAKEIGSVKLGNINLKNVILSQTFQSKLLSVAKFVDGGCLVTFDVDCCSVIDKETNAQENKAQHKIGQNRVCI